MTETRTVYSTCCGAKLYETTAQLHEPLTEASITHVYDGVEARSVGELIVCPKCGFPCGITLTEKS